MKIKEVLRVAIFLLIGIACFSAASRVFCYDDPLDSEHVWGEYYEQPAGTIDGVYFGTSITQRGWISPYAYKKDGLTIYNLATASQPIVLTKYLMEEAQKTQDIKLFVIDIRDASKSSDVIKDAAIRRVTDTVKDSPNRVRMVRGALDFASRGENTIDTKDLSYFIKIMKYHGRWNGHMMGESEGVTYYKGFAFFEPTEFRIRTVDDNGSTEDTLEMAEETEEVITDLLDYCDTLDAQVLFVAAPLVETLEEQSRVNAAQKMIEERGYTVLNFFHQDMRDIIGVDYDTFFYNDSHMNYFGATSYTDYVSSYIREHYDLPDRREDPGCSSWDESYNALMDQIGDKYDKMLKKLEKMK